MMISGSSSSTISSFAISKSSLAASITFLGLIFNVLKAMDWSHEFSTNTGPYRESRDSFLPLMCFETEDWAIEELEANKRRRYTFFSILSMLKFSETPPPPLLLLLLLCRVIDKLAFCKVPIAILLNVWFRSSDRNESLSVMAFAWPPLRVSFLSLFHISISRRIYWPRTLLCTEEDIFKEC